MTSFGLTPREKQVLDFIRSYAAEHNGVTPSYDEIRIAQAFASKGGVARIVKGLEARGHIRRMAGRARSIEVIEQSSAERDKAIWDLCVAARLVCDFNSVDDATDAMRLEALQEAMEKVRHLTRNRS